MAPEEGQQGRVGRGSLAHMSLAYTPRDGAREEQLQQLTLVADPQHLADADAGLLRGPVLVDEATSLIAATQAYHQLNDPEAAWQQVRALRQRLDADLEPERDLVRKLEELLAFRAGHQGEAGRVAERDPVTGLPLGG